MPDRPTPELPSPDQLRGLLSPRLSRRHVLQAGGLSALTLALAGCSIPGAKQTTSGAGGVAAQRADIAAFWAKQTKAGQLNFANWPLYIDVNPKNQNDRPSLDLFTQRTGIKVKYDEVIQDNDSFFGKIQPVLSAGQGIGYDLMVITNGLYLDKLVELNYLIPLNQNAMSNFYLYASDLVKDPSYDRGNVFTMAWQSGITGIGYDRKRTGRAITSWQDLQDPAFKGKIGMFGDTQDLPNSALLAIGVPPETSQVADWHKAAAWLDRQRPLVRKYYEQDYIAPLSKGDIWISMAWSGDIFQANASGADLDFVIPKEGAAIWTDNMCIPAHAEHPVDAMIYMDFVYQPEIAAMIAEYVNYITPVPASQAVIKQDAAKLTGADRTAMEQIAVSPLIFPDPSDYARLHRYRVLASAEEEKTWDDIFEPVYQS